MNASLLSRPSRIAAKDLRRWLVYFGLGLMLCGAVAGYWLSQLRADQLPELTQIEFERAWQNWQAQPPQDYEIQVTVQGGQPGTYRVEVEQGVAIAAFLNEKPLPAVRTRGTWSVPGMFETIRWDLKNQADLHLLLRARFNSRGVPVDYQRIELRSGAHDALQWKVDRWETH